MGTSEARWASLRPRHPRATPGARTGRAVGRGARATAPRGQERGARPPERAGSFTVRQARRASQAEGAGDSGLSRLIELHAFNAAGDAAVAISLAGTLFFQVPTGEARGQVALFLGLTMLPFAIVAPLIGPFLDRFSHGRRWAIGVDHGDPRLPVLGAGHAPPSRTPRGCSPRRWACLVASKAYGVTRAAAVPRLLPRPRPSSRPTPGSRWPASSARGVGPARGARLDWPDPSGRCATPSWCSWSPPSWRSGCPSGSTRARARATWCSPATTATSSPTPQRARRGCGSPARSRSRCGPTAGRAGSPGFLTMFMAFLLRDDRRSATGSPEVAARAS